MKKLSPRVWLTLILVGMVGQFAWTIENMYFNVYLYNTISTDPGYISAMVGWSAAAATLTTLLMGALSDRVGKRKLFICGGYLLWGLSTAAFGLVTVENAAKLFPAASAAAVAGIFTDQYGHSVNLSRNYCKYRTVYDQYCSHGVCIQSQSFFLRYGIFMGERPHRRNLV